MFESHGHGHLKKGRTDIPDDLLVALHKTANFLFGDGLAIYPDPLSEIQQVGGGIKSGF